MVIDVRADDRIGLRDAEAFGVTARACEVAGWEFRRVGTVDPVLAANVRWLSRYRNGGRAPASREPGRRRALAEVIPMPIFDPFAEADKPW